MPSRHGRRPVLSLRALPALPAGAALPASAALAAVALAAVALLFAAAPLPGHAEQAPAQASAAAPATEAAALQAAAEAGLAAIAALEARAKSLPGGEQALAQQALIEQAKRDLQRQLLLVQLDFARRDGRGTKAAAIEAVLQRMDAPPAVEPQARPLPSTPDQAR